MTTSAQRKSALCQTGKFLQELCQMKYSTRKQIIKAADILSEHYPTNTMIDIFWQEEKCSPK